MKKFNVVLCVAILLIAIAGLICSASFFVKSDDFKGRYDELRKVAENAATSMDKDNSGSYTNKINELKKKGTTIAKVKSTMNEWQKQGKDLAEQRAKLLETMAEIAKAGEFEFDQKAVENVGDANALNSFAQQVGTVFRTRNDIYSALEKLIPGTITKSAIESGKTNVLDEFKAGLQKISDDRSDAAKAISDIAATVNAPEFQESDNNYIEVGNKIVAALEAFMKDANAQKEQLDIARQANAKINAEVNEQNSKIAGQRTQIEDKEQFIAAYNDAKSGKSRVIKETELQDGSVEAKLELTGKVISVDRELGIVEINVGTETKVKRDGSDKEVNPGIQKGCEMFIVRDLDTAKPEFVTGIKLEKVSANVSVARIPADSEKIKKGDSVIVCLGFL